MTKSPTALGEFRYASMQKSATVAEIGESTLLLTAAIARALRANDRVKYLFTLLQNARVPADNASTELSTFATKREQAGESVVHLDTIVRGSHGVGPGRYFVPLCAEIPTKRLASVEEMVLPVATLTPR